VAQRHGLALLFDAAHAFGCASVDGPVGSFGVGEVFSFHGTKFVNAFEGGAVVTDDDALAERLRLLRNFGFTDYDSVSSLGTNAKMSEMSAAMGLTSIEAMDQFVHRNEVNATAYRAGLQGVPGLRLLDPHGQRRSNFQYVVLEVDEQVAGRSRDEVMQVLHRHGVLARRYFFPGCHRSEPYRSRTTAPALLPVTERLCRSVLVLPTGTAVTESDVQRVCALVRSAVA
jgi:dTDP-4-amino-4,6-dideoxygalactose transaminase